MKTILGMIGIGTFLLIVALFALCIVAFIKNPFLNGKSHRRHLRRVALENENLTPKTHVNSRTYFADAAIARYLLVKSGSDQTHAAVCGAADRPLGNSDDAPDAAEYPFAVELFGLTNKSRIAVASEAIAVDADVYTAASGKVQDEPAVAGTYWRIGKALQSASGNNDKFEFQPCLPVKVVVIAAFTSTNGTAAAASASLANLAAEAEKIGDDVRALAAALATPAEVKVLS